MHAQTHTHVYIDINLNLIFFNFYMFHLSFFSFFLIIKFLIHLSLNSTAKINFNLLKIICISCTYICTSRLWISFGLFDIPVSISSWLESIIIYLESCHMISSKQFFKIIQIDFFSIIYIRFNLYLTRNVTKKRQFIYLRALI